MGDTIAMVVPWAVGGLLLLGVIVSLVMNVSGTWERLPTPEEERAAHELGRALPRERIVFGQFGPFVTGRRELPGGHQEFSGFMIGWTLRISRRDHGVHSLIKQGFPEKIAHAVDGDITAKLKLRLTNGGLTLEGSFTPHKIEFTHRPPKITGRHALPPVPRGYRRLTAAERAVVEKVTVAEVENQA